MPCHCKYNTHSITLSTWHTSWMSPVGRHSITFALISSIGVRFSRAQHAISWCLTSQTEMDLTLYIGPMLKQFRLVDPIPFQCMIPIIDLQVHSSRRVYNFMDDCHRKVQNFKIFLDGASCFYISHKKLVPFFLS